MRPYLQKLQENTKQPFVLDFKPGGNSVIGNLYVVKSKPDGYTYLVSASGLPILPAFTPDLPYDTIRDFAPVSSPDAWTWCRCHSAPARRTSSRAH